MSYHLTMLAYDMNGQLLSFGHGAPLRLRNETRLGFKLLIVPDSRHSLEATEAAAVLLTVAKHS